MPAWGHHLLAGRRGLGLSGGRQHGPENTYQTQARVVPYEQNWPCSQSERAAQLTGKPECPCRALWPVPPEAVFGVFTCEPCPLGATAGWPSLSSCETAWACENDAGSSSVHLAADPDNSALFRDVKGVGSREVVTTKPGYKEVVVQQLGELRVSFQCSLLARELLPLCLLDHINSVISATFAGAVGLPPVCHPPPGH
jgi:hypothetical protein